MKNDFNNEIENGCRCAQATCGCDAAPEAHCSCEGGCGCRRECHCEGGCACAANQ